jgi:hypothetical protein
MVYLDQPRFQSCIEHDVEAQNLETELVLHIIGLARPIEMSKRGLPRYECLNNNILDFILSFLDLVP